MTPDEARELFSAAFEAELEEAQARAFRSALAADSALAAEYAEFTATMRALRERAGAPTPAAPNLLPKIQRRLRARSRGRFYADRFSERLGLRNQLPITLGLAMLVMLALLAFGLHFLQQITLSHP